MGAAMETVHHIFGTKGASGYGSYSTSSDVVGGVLGGGGVNRLEGKTVLVTGCNCGIGKETVLALCRLEPKVVVMACRDTDKARAAAADVVAAVPGARVKVMPLDLSMMASVRQFAAAFLQSEEGQSLHLLINNAGVMMCPKTITEEGHELQFATNHLGHFLLTNLLLGRMKATAKRDNFEGRVVIVASAIHAAASKGAIYWDDLAAAKSYSSVMRYAHSKIANVLHAHELSRRLEEEGAGVVAVSLHPGAIITELGRHLEAKIPKALDRVLRKVLSPLFKSIPQGAATTMYLATADKIAKPGGYYADCNVASQNPDSEDPAIAARLWEVSEQLVKEA
eukprot:CAMPEP_0182905246 /NCGR_PEP_ID=MMETSP0034_2-20130328/32788_1 /TAXON_ID=156128 /ORGANISM="Nephroselmis pyriformis, Strain CCMP717" /LENGTH=337 /DNA_ID=CAMNT_0025040619 /DNA_START=305 /DNA_END=1318 /DNA_ORIENTATION=-